MAWTMETVQASSVVAEAQPVQHRWRRVLECFGFDKSPKAWFIDNHLLVFLFSAFLIGLSAPYPGQKVSKLTVDMGSLGEVRVVQFINVALIFLISGFRLKTDAALSALRHPTALVCAWVSIILWTPVLGFAAARLPLGTDEFSRGLALFCCVPTTLTSGAALVAGCKGANRATELALMITVSTNVVGCFTTPVWLRAIWSGMSVELDVGKLLVKLMMSLLAPTIVGKAAQVLIPGAAKCAKDYKTSLTMFSNFNLVCVVWQSVSRDQHTIVAAGGRHILECICCGVLLHLALWAMNSPVFAVPKIRDVHQRRAVLLLGSQKTLPVCLAIIAGLPEGDFGDTGLMTLPCIFGHLSQLVIDTFLVDYWAKLPDNVAKEAARPPLKAGLLVSEAGGCGLE